MRFLCVLPTLALMAVLAIAKTASAADEVNFSRDVLPILSDRCFHCHGPDEKRRKADLRLDVPDGAVAKVGSSSGAIVPGKPEESELFTRITSDDPDLLMPPANSHRKKLTPDQVEIMRKWIAGGAVWSKHWAFDKPVRPAVPKTDAEPGQHPIDAFVTARLQKEKLTPAPAAAKHTLIRRLSFDVTGLPPTLAEVEAFQHDTAPTAYDTLVDRLLKSPHFGERMAMWWLDAARYSDTDGYQGDATRTNWPWRDWVVAAFNRNQHFDQFTQEQFAGDLLPNATPDQKLATCFHRNHMTNGEGGRDPEESRIDYNIDRVNTVGTVWLGLTLGCTQCHSHKYDPITHANYYQLFAFFNNIDEDGKASTAAKPYLSYQSPLAARAVTEAQQLVDLRQPLEAQARRDAEQPFAAWLDMRWKEVRGGFQAWRTLTNVTLESTEGTQFDQEADGTVQTLGPNPVQDDYRVITHVDLPRITGLKLDVLPLASHTNGGLSRGQTGEFFLTDIKVQVRRRGSAQVRDILVADAVADFSADKKANDGYGPVKETLDDDPRNGWTTIGSPTSQTHTAVFALAEPLVLAPDEELVFEMRHRSTLGDTSIGRFLVSVTDQLGSAIHSVDVAPLEQLAQAKLTDLSKIDTKLRAALFEQFLDDYVPYTQPKEALERAKAQLAEVKAAAKVNVMVMAERATDPRSTHILLRGVWDKKGDKVDCDVPPAIAAWPAGEPRTRLGLAHWLTSRDNPLTARVVVNNLWQMFFGAGIVRTPEDFGLQGEGPTHPELLDWLAVEFMESGWDVKHIVRLIVTSDTYQQSSAASEALIARDPDNRLLARGARFRLPSWMLRDAALQTSGLLNGAIGGPPVRPYQPDGVWEEMFMGRFHYEPSEGAAQYRRTLYAFWRRAIAPTFLFDSAQRRVCEVRTSRTNTPLQALTLLNDATYLEASRTLAAQALHAAEDTPGRLRALALRILSRPPTNDEVTVLTRELNRGLAHYRAHPKDAARLIAQGQSPADAKLDVAEYAAHMLVASLLLNLDEAITHE